MSRAFWMAAFLGVMLPLQGGSPKSPAVSDAQIEELAHQGLASKSEAEQRSVLKQLQEHHFKSTLAKEREFTLFAQALLEDRLGDPNKASVTFKKLERGWPGSIYMPEGQIILARASLEAKRYKDAESRLQKALHADIPVESKRKAQEMLLWLLVEQHRNAEAQPLVKGLYPLPEGENPSEHGLVAITETLCQADEMDQAEASRKDLVSLYPKSPYLPRVELAWAQVLGRSGKAKESATVLRKLITSAPTSPEADDAKLALATLLSEGKLDPKTAAELPSAQKLLDEIHATEHKGEKGRKALLVQLRVHLSQSHWREALEVTNQLRAMGRNDSSDALITQMRDEALRALVQQLLDTGGLEKLLPYLDAEGIAALQPEQRMMLVRQLAKSGLSAATRTLVAQAPAKEREALRRAALEATPGGTQAEDTLALMPPRQESPAESLKRAQALLSLRRWKEARVPLARATPGSDRIAAILLLLRRAKDKDEGPSSRLKEAEGWLARLLEKPADREPLAILVADLRAQSGDWRGALSLYPTNPAASEHRGWVSLMRATCQSHLGQKDQAKATLKAAQDIPGFKMERQTLAKSLGL